MKKALLHGTYTADFDTGWIEIGSDNYLFNAASLTIIWDAASGTAFDGTIQVYLSNDKNANVSLMPVVHNVAIDAASSAGKDNNLGIVVPFYYIRIKLTMNSLTTADIDAIIVYDRREA